MLQCRQPPAAPIEDAPADFLTCPAFAAQVLGVVTLERQLDRVEWECIEGL